MEKLIEIIFILKSWHDYERQLELEILSRLK